MKALVESTGYTVGPRSSELERRRRCKSGFILKSAPEKSSTGRFDERFLCKKRNASSHHGVTNLVDRRQYGLQSATEDDTKATKLTDLDGQNELVLCPQLGGLRQDPFDALPVASTGLVTDAFDYFVIVYAPSATRAAGLSEDFAAIFITELVHDRMPFEACIAFALVVRSLDNDIDSRVSQTILEYSARGISSLRKRNLSGLNATSDMVIWTILALCTFLADDTEAMRAHLEALQQIVALRGGVENLSGLRGYLKPRVRQLITTITATLSLLDQQTLYLGKDTAKQSIYPSHPFSPSLCRKISKLSSGFRELALSKKLSVQVINYLHEIFEFVPCEGVSDVSYIFRYKNVTTLERLLAAALCVRVILVEKHTSAHTSASSAAYHMYIKRHFKQLASELLASNQNNSLFTVDAQIWACLVLRGASQQGNSSKSWVDMQLFAWAAGQLSTVEMTETRQQELEEAFLPIS